MVTKSTGDTLDKKAVEATDPLPFKEISFMINFPVKEVIGRDITDDFEARVFQSLVNQFFSSSVVFNQMVVFVNTYFEQAKKDIKKKETGILLP